MKTFIMICLSGLFVPMSGYTARTPYVEPGAAVYVDVDAETVYQGWTGPGWYYGVWFDTEADYDYWLRNRFYDTRWAGPGWYYGVWFDIEWDFDDYRWNHRYYDRDHRHHGDHRMHRNEHRGQWKGRGGGGGHRGHGR